MTFILVHCIENSITRIIWDWMEGRRRQELQSYFMEKLDTRTYLMESNGKLLSLLWSLKRRYNNKLDIFIAEPLYERDLPKEIKEVVKCLEKNPKMRKELEKVKNLKIVCSLNLRIK